MVPDVAHTSILRNNGEAHRCAGLVILEAFMDCPPGKLFLSLPQPVGFEDVKSVPLKFAVEQRGIMIPQSRNPLSGSQRIPMSER